MPSLPAAPDAGRPGDAIPSRAVTRLGRLEHAVQRWVGGLPFRRKLTTLPTLAIAALGVVLLLNLGFGALNDWQLQRITRGYHPAIEASRDLQELLAGIQGRLRDAVAARDAAQLVAVDTMRARFVTLVDAQRDNPVIGARAADSLATAFGTYYAAGRWASARLIEEAHGDSVVRALERMTSARRGIEATLAGLRGRSTRESARAAVRAGRLQRTAWIVSLIVTAVALLAITRLLVVVTATIADPVAEAARAAERIARGEIVELSGAEGSDELAQLRRAMHEMGRYLADMARTAETIAGGDLSVAVTPRGELDAFGHAFATMTAYLRRIAESADAIAAGDLSVRVTPQSERDSFGRALQTMTDTLSYVINEIRHSTDAITDAADHLSDSAQQLSAGVEEESALTSETSSSLREVDALITDNAAASEQAESIAGEGARDASAGLGAFRETVEALLRIAQTVGVMQRLADETNLLALNAAIEAARVGEHGRGFAVVAAGVRDLSIESQRAAVSISDLALGSRRVAERSRELLEQLVPRIEQTAALVQTVSATSARQRDAVRAVNTAMSDVDRVTKQNAQAAEQLAATAEELAAQAEVLRGTVGFFRTASKAGGAALPLTHGAGQTA